MHDVCKLRFSWVLVLWGSELLVAPGPSGSSIWSCWQTLSSFILADPWGVEAGDRAPLPIVLSGYRKTSSKSCNFFFSHIHRPSQIFFYSNGDPSRQRKGNNKVKKPSIYCSYIQKSQEEGPKDRIISRGEGL